jgi:hypothetical protein
MNEISMEIESGGLKTETVELRDVDCINGSLVQLINQRQRTVTRP